MGSNQSSFVISRNQALAQGHMFRGEQNVEAAGILEKIVDSMAEYNCRTINRISKEKPISFRQNKKSNAEMIDTMHEVLKQEPITIERSNGCAQSTSDLVDIVMFAQRIQNCCGQSSNDQTTNCLNCCEQPRAYINEDERLSSLIASLKSVDEYVKNLPKSKTSCFCPRDMIVNKEIVSLMLKLSILDRIDNSLLSRINSVVPHHTIKSIISGAELQFEPSEGGLQTTPSEKVDRENELIRDFTLSSRVGRDFITNSLLEEVFHSSSKTVIKGKKDFLTEHEMLDVDSEQVSKQLLENYSNLGKKESHFLPNRVMSVIEIIRSFISINQITARIKTSDSIVNKDSNDRLIQDKFGVRLFASGERTFSLFSKSLLSAIKLMEKSDIRSIMISHKLKEKTNWLDFKIIIEYTNLSIFEIQIIPVNNFIVDESVGGHDQHKNESPIESEMMVRD